MNEGVKIMNRKQVEKHFDALAKPWTSGFVAREKISEFTGGVISSGTMANLKSKGISPEYIIIGRKVVYPIKPLIAWLKTRLNCSLNGEKQ